MFALVTVHIDSGESKWPDQDLLNNAWGSQIALPSGAAQLPCWTQDLLCPVPWWNSYGQVASRNQKQSCALSPSCRILINFITRSGDSVLVYSCPLSLGGSCSQQLEPPIVWHILFIYDWSYVVINVLPCWFCPLRQSRYGRNKKTCFSVRKSCFLSEVSWRIYLRGTGNGCLLSVSNAKKLLWILAFVHLFCLLWKADTQM